MRIRRAPRPEEKFYILNKAISEDARLSWAARGVLIFLLGKPDNWEVSVKHLINQTTNAIGKASGRDAVRVILKELEEAGYLVADIGRGDSGVFSGMEYLINETPHMLTPETENPAPVNPAPAEPAPENPHQVSTDLKQDTEKEGNTDKSNVHMVFDHWRLKMASPRSKLDSNRTRLITNALKNYTAEDLLQAIDGCAASPFHMGINDQKTKYNGLDLILRNAEKIDSFIVKAISPPVACNSNSKHHDLAGKSYGGEDDDAVQIGGL